MHHRSISAGKHVVLFAAASILVLLSCDESVTPPDTFVPLVSAFWTNVQNNNHTFVLISDDDGEASGAFTGDENHPTLGQSQLDGTFQNSRVTFTVHRSAGDVVFSGRFVHADTMNLSSSAGALRLAR